MRDDTDIADLLSALADRYRRQIAAATLPRNQTRLDVLRRLELITESIRGLMKYDQDAL